MHYFRKPEERTANSATSNSHTLPNSNFTMEKKEKKKVEVQWKKTFKITQKKVQRTLQSFQLVLLKTTRNEKTHVPDQLFNST